MNFYLNKYGFCPPQVKDVIDPRVSLIVVIPCYNELNLIESLNVLYECDEPTGAVEVITVINASEKSEDEIKRQNEETYKTAKNWAETHQTDTLKFHFILNNNLPKKHAGVGLARKIGMDEAVSRFETIEKDGVIVCFDADSNCNKNYLVEIEKHFKTHPKTPGCSIHYEHPIAGNAFDSSVYKGIINYELFLRYYNQGLLYCELPFAFQTVGSSMAVKSSAYQKQGGMNKRKAGEDFYFIHKIIALGGFTNLSTTKVIPSPRISDRVPFGTGKAIGDWVENKMLEYKTYDFEIWKIIKSFVQVIPELEAKELTQTDFVKDTKHQVFIDFLKANKFDESLFEIRKNSTNSTGFLKRFFVWFNAFRVLKVVHYLRDNQYENQPIINEVEKLALALNFYDGAKTLEEYLELYRAEDKKI